LAVSVCVLATWRVVVKVVPSTLCATVDLASTCIFGNVRRLLDSILLAAGIIAKVHETIGVAGVTQAGTERYGGGRRGTQT